MQEKRSEGIVLKATPFRDYDSILTVFTHALGLTKALVRGGYRLPRHRSKNSSYPLVVAPFTCAEFIFLQGKSDLYVCSEIEVIDSFSALRNDLSALEAASTLSHLILSTQFPGKNAPQLYVLLRYYFALLQRGNPQVLTSSFRLKLLRHEGLLSLQANCCRCGSPLSEAALFQGESLCPTHASPQALFFSAQEWTLLMRLAYSRSIEELLTTVDSLEEKVIQLFECAIKD